MNHFTKICVVFGIGYVTSTIEDVLALPFAINFLVNALAVAFCCGVLYPAKREQS